MSATSGVKHLHLIQRNAKWWGAPIGAKTKLSYYGFIASALTRAVATKRKSVRYLGHVLRYDNFATPLSLQLYPYEINNSILANAPDIKIKRVLDIGGNIGQFSLTLSHALKDKARIDVIEPNPDIYELLHSNTQHKTNIHTYNFGIGRPGMKDMFYTPGKSATGSLYISNTSDKTVAKKTKVALINDVVSLTDCRQYDLTKIDVEGYEYNSLEAIKPFKTKLMFIEISGLGRYKNYHHSKLLSLIEKKFGEFDIRHISAADRKSNNFDILLHFV